MQLTGDSVDKVYFEVLKWVVSTIDFRNAERSVIFEELLLHILRRIYQSVYLLSLYVVVFEGNFINSLVC